MYINNTGI